MNHIAAALITDNKAIDFILVKMYLNQVKLNLISRNTSFHEFIPYIFN